MSQRFNLFIVSHIGCQDKDLIYQLVRLIDESGILFAEREKQIKTYSPFNMRKTTRDVLLSAPNSEDFIILDRVEWKWEPADVPYLTLLKTWAPLSGKLKMDEVDFNPFELHVRTPAFRTLLSDPEQLR